MTRYIDADYFLKEYCEPYPHIYEAMSAAINHMPTADVVPVRYGKWIPWKYHNGFRCEKCNEPVDNKHNYCPNCGADMRGEDG